MDFFFKIIKIIIPRPIRHYWRQKVKAYMLRNSPRHGHPNPQLQDIHIESMKVLLNRSKLIEVLPKEGIVAEIGVAKGDFSNEILLNAEPKQLHLIDAWHTVRYGPDIRQNVLDRFEVEIDKGKIQIHQGLSTEVGKTFPDEYFDWIYIDTDHSYLTTKAELEIYSKKVKRNGIIAGHDLTKGNFEKWIPYGVIEAVFEFCVTHHWKIIYTSMEWHEYPSFAIQRIDQ